MRLKIIDYICNYGGGQRFTIELIKAFKEKNPDIEIELISYGDALSRYKKLINENDLKVTITSIKYKNYLPHIIDSHLNGGFYSMLNIFRNVIDFSWLHSDWYFEIPEISTNNDDIIWLPWIHRHKLGKIDSHKVICSFHDAIILQLEKNKKILEIERKNMREFFSSQAIIAVSSESTKNAIIKEFNLDNREFPVIRLSPFHSETTQSVSEYNEFNLPNRNYIICPANISPHKNHEILLEGIAKWGFKHPLVLTGEGTELKPNNPRANIIKLFAEKKGFKLNVSLIPLGYVNDNTYNDLLENSWALIIPTLAEGGGSFPVWEALIRGIPVICSNIPVMLEQINYINTKVIWFDPCDANDLFEKLEDLSINYDKYKEMAVNQASKLNSRSWEDVAKDYYQLMKNCAL
jgi:glycosyltransferase involved in cell wall biosynthesis